MRAVFHIISLGAGAGASRVTRYISERDKDLTREGTGSRPLFSEDREGLTYRKADRVLDPYEGKPSKDDLLHFSVSLEENEFDKLGDEERDKQERLREVIRNGMRGMAEELNVERLNWVAGIHRNSDHPHAHIVFHKNAIERGTGKPKRIGRIPKHLLPHKEMQNDKEVIVNSRIGDRFLDALDNQQHLHIREQGRGAGLTRAERWDLLARKHQQTRAAYDRATSNARVTGITSLDHKRISVSWNAEHQVVDDHNAAFRITLGKRLELEMRLAFAEASHDRALNHGNTYRFQVMDQSTGQERRISELDVRRRAAARASRRKPVDDATRNKLIDSDLVQHAQTLRQLSAARENKIEALGKDIASLRRNLSTIEGRLSSNYTLPADRAASPLMSRETLAELQAQAARLNLPERVLEIEELRLNLAGEHNAPARNDSEAATLVAQLNVARADFRARDSRLDNFEFSSHLTPYEIGTERWSLASLDKHIIRREEAAKLIPRRAARLDLRSLAFINYSSTKREQAASDVEHLKVIREKIVQEIERRREQLIADRNVSRSMRDMLEGALVSERDSRSGKGLTMPGAKYNLNHIASLESSAETLRDSSLIQVVHEWEKAASKTQPEINWEGRAVARVITSQLALNDARDRLHHFSESKEVASLNLDNHRTAALRQVEAGSLTEYVSRVINQTKEQRDFRQTVRTAARKHHDRLISEFETIQQYSSTTDQLAQEAQTRTPQFTDKERINVEIYEEKFDSLTWDRSRGSDKNPLREFLETLTR